MNNSFMRNKKHNTYHKPLYSLSDLADAFEIDVHCLNGWLHWYPLPKHKFITKKRNRDIKLYDKVELVNWYYSLPINND